MIQLLSVQKFFDGIVHDIVGGHKGAASGFTAFRGIESADQCLTMSICSASDAIGILSRPGLFD